MKELNGYIKLHRALLNWEWYDDINVTRLWLHILLSANFQRNKWRGVTIEPGQFVTSYAKLAKETGLSIKTVRTSLNKLKTTREVASEAASSYTVITVLKWADYQESEKTGAKETASPAASEGQAKGKARASEGQQRKNDKNDKNDKKDSNTDVLLPGAGVHPVISLPLHDNTEYPVTQTLIDKWSALYPAVDVMQELRKMCGWLDSHPNRRKTRRGVPGFITGWLGREQDRGRVTAKPKGGASPPKLCALDDLFETFDEEAT